MGYVRVKAKVSDESRSKLIEVDALIDVGATLTTIPREIALALNLKPSGKFTVETSAGRLELEHARVWIELKGKSGVVSALISDLTKKVLIGLTTLEILGLRVDPRTGKLKEWPPLPLRQED